MLRMPTLWRSDADADRKPMGLSDFLVGFIVVLAGLAGLFGVWRYSAALVHCLESRCLWVEVPCVVQHVACKESGGGRRAEHYEVVISYSYCVGGQVYSGQRYDWWPANFGSERAARRVQEVRKDAGPHCYVNPAAPQESVYDVWIDWFAWGAVFVGGSLFGFLGLLVGVGMCLELWERVSGRCRRQKADA